MANFMRLLYQTNLIQVLYLKDYKKFIFVHSLSLRMTMKNQCDISTNFGDIIIFLLSAGRTIKFTAGHFASNINILAARPAFSDPLLARGLRPWTHTHQPDTPTPFDLLKIWLSLVQGQEFSFFDPPPISGG